MCMDPVINPFAYVETMPCLVYSVGIRKDWTFDEAMENYGCEVFSFDPSMGQSDHDHSKKVHFKNLALGSRNYVDEKTNWKYQTLDSIHEMLSPLHGMQTIDYLKIDIEGGEWEVMQQVIESGMLSQVRQMFVEFHLFAQHPNGTDLSIQDYKAIAGLVKSIEKKMIRFQSRNSLWSYNRKTNLAGTENGPHDFELSFYQILPASNTSPKTN